MTVIEMSFTTKGDRAMSKNMNLYYVSTTVAEYIGRRDVVFSWFYNGEQKPRPYAKLIKDYEAGNLYAEGAIDELFTFAEARALKAYLDREHGDHGATIIRKAKLPIENNMAGFGAIAVGGSADFYTLDKEGNYDLPFSAWGYFDLLYNECVKRAEAPKASSCIDADIIPF